MAESKNYPGKQPGFIKSSSPASAAYGSKRAGRWSAVKASGPVGPACCPYTLAECDAKFCKLELVPFTGWVKKTPTLGCLPI